MSVEQKDVDRFTEMLQDFGIPHSIDTSLNIVVVECETDDGGTDLNVDATGFTFVFRRRDGKFLSAT